MKKMSVAVPMVIAVLVLVCAGVAMADAPYGGKHTQMAQQVHAAQQMVPVINESMNKSAAPLPAPMLGTRYRALIEARERTENARRGYEDSLKRYHGLGIGIGSVHGLEVLRGYALSRAELMLSNAELVRAHMRAWEAQCYLPPEKLDEYVRQMEQHREAIRSARSAEEVQEINQRMTAEWQRMSMEMQLCAQQIAAQRMLHMLAQAENASTTLAGELERLRAAGINTSTLHSRLNQYNTSLHMAIEHEERARELLRVHAGFDDEGRVVDMAQARATLKSTRAELAMATGELRGATRALKKAFLELKQRRAGLLTLHEGDTLHAQGNGMAVFSGGGEVMVDGTGLLRVMDVAGDAVVDTTGKGIVLPDGTLQYELEDSATINGTSFTLSVRGEGVVLDINGVGSVVLIGNGTYTLVGANGTASASWHVPWRGVP